MGKHMQAAISVLLRRLAIVMILFSKSYVGNFYRCPWQRKVSSWIHYRKLFCRTLLHPCVS